MGDSGESKNFCDQRSLLGQVEGREDESYYQGNNSQYGLDDAARKIQQWWLMWRFIKWLPERRRFRQWWRNTLEWEPWER